MCRWLDEQIGPNRWWHVEETLPTPPDTMLFYFVTVADPQAFIDCFSWGVWIKGEWPHGGTVSAHESDMRGSAVHKTR